MHLDKRAKQKKRLLKLEFVASLVALTSLLLMHGRARVESSTAGQLEVVQTFRVPIKELSALVPTRQAVDGNVEFLSIGDHNAELVAAKFESGSLELSSYDNFQTSLLQRMGVCTVMQNDSCRKMANWLSSQWEAIAVDQRFIYTLHEQAGFIAKIARQSMEVSNLINLNYSSQSSSDVSPNLKREKIGENSLGEGMVLLKHGHLLITKQEKPAQMIEFGPEGDQPTAFLTSSLVDSDGDWQQKATTLVPLHRWRVPPELKDCDLTELSYDAAGHLYILSKTCKLIAKLGEFTPASEQLMIDRVWMLPERVNYAEALIVLDQGQFLIGEDVKTLAPNIFLLTEKR